MTQIVTLITGANKGIGLSTVVSLLKDPNQFIIAGVRNPEAATKLQALAKESGRVHILKISVSDLESVKAAFPVVASLPAVRDHGIDLLFLNAGAYNHLEVPASAIDGQRIRDALQINLLGAVYPAQVFLPLVRLGKKKTIVYTSSAIGSTTLDLGYPGFPAGAFGEYGISKSAANHFVRRLAAELKEEGFSVSSYHPGAVAVEGYFAPAGTVIGDVTVISQEEGGQRAADFLTSRTAKDTGKFFSAEDGSEIPW